MDTADIKVAGRAAIMQAMGGKPLRCRYTAPAHSTIIARVWLDQEKYFHRVAKSPHWVSRAPTPRTGTDSSRRFFQLPWSMWNQSDRVRRAERKAVSPEVMGQAIDVYKRQLSVRPCPG